MRWFYSARLALAAAIGILALGAGTASATPVPRGGMTLVEVDAWLKAGGFETTINTEHNYVLAVVNGQKLVVFAGDCFNQRCQSLQYYYGVSYPAGVRPDDAAADKLANGWNKSFRWAKSFIDDRRNIVLESDFSLSPNVDTESLNHSLITFIEVIPIFRSYIRTN